MKNLLITLLLLLSANYTFAHFMWIETSPSGKLNQKHEVKVYFGEYTYGVTEKVEEEAFGKMKNFEVWIIGPSGEKSKLQMQPAANFYSGSFSPSSKGTYTVVLNNNKVDVIDYTQYNFGIFKTHYHSTARIDVGTGAPATAAANNEGITIVDVTGKAHAKGGEAVLKVLYKGEPLKENELTAFISVQWSKKLYTDKDGLVRLSLPWDSVYVFEATKKEELPGTYNGKEYQFIWHCATYRIAADRKL